MMARASNSASRNASVMPWAVSGSLKYPASPTSPSGPGAAFDETGVPAEPPNGFDHARIVEPRAERRRSLTNQPAVRRRRVTADLVAETTGRHRHEHAHRAVVG